MNFKKLIEDFEIGSIGAKFVLSEFLNEDPKEIAERFDRIIKVMDVSEKAILCIISAIMYLFRFKYLTEGEYRMLMQIVIEGQIMSVNEKGPSM